MVFEWNGLDDVGVVLDEGLVLSNRFVVDLCLLTEKKGVFVNGKWVVGGKNYV